VAEDERQAGDDRALAVDGLEVGAAHAGRLDPDPDLAGARIGDLDVADLQRGVEGGQHGRAHQHAPTLARPSISNKRLLGRLTPLLGELTLTAKPSER
jgi:hypothetical protein